MRNAELEETQAGIKIAERNINNLRYADDTTFMVEREEELKSILMKWETMEILTDFILGGSKIQILKDDAGKVLHSICQQI